MSGRVGWLESRHVLSASVSRDSKFQGLSLSPFENGDVGESLGEAPRLRRGPEESSAIVV